MLIARAKRKENIIEYLLYMYQIEDIIRSLDLDPERVRATIVEQFDQGPEVKQKIYEWYLDLIQSMVNEEKTKSGHLEQLVTLVEELQKFHEKLLAIYQDKEYQKKYEQARPILRELVMRSGGKRLINEIDVAINGVYGYLVLRLKRAEISEATESGIQKVKAMLAHLAFQYKKKEEGSLKLDSNGN